MIALKPSLERFHPLVAAADLDLELAIAEIVILLAVVEHLVDPARVLGRIERSGPRLSALEARLVHEPSVVVTEARADVDFGVAEGTVEAVDHDQATQLGVTHHRAPDHSRRFG